MTTSPAPDVDRVLDRMGRSAFAYRSFPRPAQDDAPPRETVPAPEPEPPSSVAATTLRFPLIAEALPAAAAPPPVMAQAALHVAPPPPAATQPIATRPVAPLAGAAPAPNPFQPPAPAAPPRAVLGTSLTGMFRLLSGRADAVRPREESRAPAFPFRHS